MDAPRRYSRRDALGLLAAAGGLASVQVNGQGGRAWSLDGLVKRNDTSVQALLQSQIANPSSSWRGSVPDQVGLHSAHSAAAVVETMTASFVEPSSRFYRDPVLFQRIELAAGFLERSQGPQGNIDLLTTNFNSPPDTGFVVHGVATAAVIGRMHGAPEITQALRSFLVRAGGGMAAGGIHTPNHRWVIGAALAQINELFADSRLVKRIDEWLAEGIDIDADGQFTERSTLTYNVVTDRALLVMAIKLKREELLDPVRRNLRALAYLLHADGEVVTEISRRQDQYTRGNTSGYWFPLTWLAISDGDPLFSAMARLAEGARLSTVLEYPELAKALPIAARLHDDFEKAFPQIGISRIRRGPLSATVMLGGSSRLLTMRYGDAVIEGIRFATSFFGKGQFIPESAEKHDGSYRSRQSLQAPYYQPLNKPITTETWASTRSERRTSEVARLDQSAEIIETGRRGFKILVRSAATAGVPLAVEICFREGGRLEGCTRIPDMPDGFVLERGTGVYRSGRNEIRFGPGGAPHHYVQLRGAEPRLSGQSVYITGYTPFEQTLTFEGG